MRPPPSAVRIASSLWRDAARAFVETIEAPMDTVRGQVFNLAIGNYKIREIAEKVQKTLPLNIAVEFQSGPANRRDFRINDFPISSGLKRR